MMELIARPGWQKIMEQFDYKKTHVVLEKQITDITKSVSKTAKKNLEKKIIT